ncbi:hypothetical protein Csa_023157 [Cucumis sativus]|uniref:Uncharacterized protein n=1 Tax=Cucumis sativus TaxID=3659 RepID=A0A0A0LXI5_CUCSA|nr:hypothetical protein Csa_023157 [Cucumis sativus]
MKCQSKFSKNEALGFDGFDESDQFEGILPMSPKLRNRIWDGSVQIDHLSLVSVQTDQRDRIIKSKGPKP